MMRAETGTKNILKSSSNMGSSFLTTNTHLATLANVIPAVKRKKKKTIFSYPLSKQTH